MTPRNFFFCLLVTVFTVSCNSGSKIDSATYNSFLQRGDEITNLAQATLLGNVSKAIKTGGTEYAVEFCNLKASSIIDSLNRENNCAISRVTDKNRNPENILNTKQEKEIWESLKNLQKLDTVVKEQQAFVYYKSIKIALPACLKCHGNPESEISQETMKKINALYPTDRATGYRLNDFRGMWKVEFR